jgi:hypothetical protein
MRVTGDIYDRGHAMRHITFPLLPSLKHAHTMPGKNAIVPPVYRAFGRLKMISHFKQAAVSAYQVVIVSGTFQVPSRTRCSVPAQKTSTRTILRVPAVDPSLVVQKSQCSTYGVQFVQHHGLMSAVVTCRRGSSGYVYTVHAYRVGNCMPCQRHGPVKLVGSSTSASNCHLRRQNDLAQQHPEPSFVTTPDQKNLSQVTEVQLKRTGKLRKQNPTHRKLKTSGPITEYDSHPPTWSSVFVSTRPIASLCCMWERNSTDPPAEHRTSS